MENQANDEDAMFADSELKARRSSILKPPKARAPLQEVNLGGSADDTEDFDTIRKRRVSFAGVNSVKEFCSNAESLQVCHVESYEVIFSTSSDNSQSNSTKTSHPGTPKHDTLGEDCNFPDDSMELADSLIVDNIELSRKASQPVRIQVKPISVLDHQEYRKSKSIGTNKFYGCNTDIGGNPEMNNFNSQFENNAVTSSDMSFTDHRIKQLTCDAPNDQIDSDVQNLLSSSTMEMTEPVKKILPLPNRKSGLPFGVQQGVPASSPSAALNLSSMDITKPVQQARKSSLYRTAAGEIGDCSMEMTEVVRVDVNKPCSLLPSEKSISMEFTEAVRFDKMSLQLAEHSENASVGFSDNKGIAEDREQPLNSTAADVATPSSNFDAIGRQGRWLTSQCSMGSEMEMTGVLPLSRCHNLIANQNESDDDMDFTELLPVRSFKKPRLSDENEPNYIQKASLAQTENVPHYTIEKPPYETNRCNSNNKDDTVPVVSFSRSKVNQSDMEFSFINDVGASANQPERLAEKQHEKVFRQSQNFTADNCSAGKCSSSSPPIVAATKVCNNEESDYYHQSTSSHKMQARNSAFEPDTTSGHLRRDYTSFMGDITAQPPSIRVSFKDFEIRPDSDEMHLNNSDVLHVELSELTCPGKISEIQLDLSDEHQSYPVKAEAPEFKRKSMPVNQPSNVIPVLSENDSASFSSTDKGILANQSNVCTLGSKSTHAGHTENCSNSEGVSQNIGDMELTKLNNSCEQYVDGVLLPPKKSEVAAAQNPNFSSQMSITEAHVSYPCSDKLRQITGQPLLSDDKEFSQMDVTHSRQSNPTRQDYAMDVISFINQNLTRNAPLTCLSDRGSQSMDVTDSVFNSVAVKNENRRPFKSCGPSFSEITSEETLCRTSREPQRKSIPNSRATLGFETDETLNKCAETGLSPTLKYSDSCSEIGVVKDSYPANLSKADTMKHSVSVDNLGVTSITDDSCEGILLKKQSTIVSDEPAEIEATFNEPYGRKSTARKSLLISGSGYDVPSECEIEMNSDILKVDAANSAKNKRVDEMLPVETLENIKIVDDFNLQKIDKIVNKNRDDCLAYSENIPSRRASRKSSVGVGFSDVPSVESVMTETACDKLLTNQKSGILATQESIPAMPRKSRKSCIGLPSDVTITQIRNPCDESEEFELAFKRGKNKQPSKKEPPSCQEAPVLDVFQELENPADEDDADLSRDLSNVSLNDDEGEFENPRTVDSCQPTSPEKKSTDMKRTRTPWVESARDLIDDLVNLSVQSETDSPLPKQTLSVAQRVSKPLEQLLMKKTVQRFVDDRQRFGLEHQKSDVGNQSKLTTIVDDAEIMRKNKALLNNYGFEFFGHGNYEVDVFRQVLALRIVVPPGELTESSKLESIRYHFHEERLGVTCYIPKEVLLFVMDRLKQEYSEIFLNVTRPMIRDLDRVVALLRGKISEMTPTLERLILVMRRYVCELNDGRIIFQVVPSRLHVVFDVVVSLENNSLTVVNKLGKANEDVIRMMFRALPDTKDLFLKLMTSIHSNINILAVE